VVPVTAGLAGAVAAAVIVAVGIRSPAPRRPGHPLAEPAETRVALGQARLASMVQRALPHRHLRRRDAQLPDALDRLASAMRAGRAIGPALGELASSAAEPLRSDLQPVTLALTHGTPVAAALAGWAARPGASADVRLVVAALTVGARSGGEVARAIDRIAATLRERREVQREVHALATQARTSAGLLAVAPLAFAALVSTIEPAAVGFLVATPLGLLCLALGLSLEGLGATWMARITRGAS